MDQQIKIFEFSKLSQNLERGHNSKIDGALSAIKAMETALKIASEAVLKACMFPEESDSFEEKNIDFRSKSPSFQLKYVADREMRIRKARSSVFPAEVLSDAPWNMMLDLFLQQQLGRDVTISSACVASEVPATTALRWIDVLEREGMVVREGDIVDKRRRFIRLSQRANAMMTKYLSMVATTRYGAEG